MNRTRSFCRRRSTRPVLETLEDRCCPALVDYFFTDGTLTIRGDRTDNLVQVETIGRNEIQVMTDRGAPQMFSDIKGVVVQTGEGNDKIQVWLHAAAGLDMFQIDAGAGNDIIAILPSKLAATEPTPGLLLPTVRINAGAGYDKVAVTLHELIGLLSFNLGGGDDRLMVEAFNSFAPSERMAAVDRPELQVSAGSGNDQVTLNYAHVGGIIDVNLGGGDDRLDVTSDPPIGAPAVVDQQELHVFAGAGNDAVTLNYAHIGGIIDVNLGAGDDRLDVMADPPGTELPPAAPPQVRVLGGVGNDTVMLNLPYIDDLFVNLGGGDDRLVAQGVNLFSPTEGMAAVDRPQSQIFAGAGNDQVTLNYARLARSLDINLGAGNDRLTVDAANLGMPADVIPIFHVNAGVGDDLVDLRLGQGPVNLDVMLGAGWDMFRLKAGDLAGADLSALIIVVNAGGGDDFLDWQLFKHPDLMNVALGAGNDMLRLNQRVSADTPSDHMTGPVTIAGGRGDDLVNVDFAALPRMFEPNLGPGADRLIKMVMGVSQ